MQWFRLYAEFAYDPKVQSMSETLQRRYVMLLCVTCNGEIEKMTDEELAFALRIGGPELESTLAELQSKRLIGADRKPLGWDRRQYKSDTSNDRVKRHRAMKRINDVTETGMKRKVTPPDSETDTESNNSKFKRRGSRFALTELPSEWREECRAMRPELNPDELFAEFRDYWIAVPGQKGCKLDWSATWRNRVREKRQINQRSFPLRQPEIKKSNVRTL